MTKDEVFAFLNAHPVCFLATTEGNQPRVRGMMLFSADESGVLFHSGEGKDLTEQLRANPAVEICVFDPETGTQVRVAGEAEFSDDMELKKSVIAARPFLQQMVEKLGMDNFLVFSVKNGVATTWTMADNFAPKSFVSL